MKPVQAEIAFLFTGQRAYSTHYTGRVWLESCHLILIYRLMIIYYQQRKINVTAEENNENNSPFKIQ